MRGHILLRSTKVCRRWSFPLQPSFRKIMCFPTYSSVAALLKATAPQDWPHLKKNRPFLVSRFEFLYQACFWGFLCNGSRNYLIKIWTAGKIGWKVTQKRCFHKCPYAGWFRRTTRFRRVVDVCVFVEVGVGCLCSIIRGCVERVWAPLFGYRSLLNQYRALVTECATPFFK